MSLCRWSTDNFSCDLYVYESDEGYVIHVAGNRVLGDIPKVEPELLMTNADAFWEQMRKQGEFLSTAERETITLPFAGETLVVENLEQLEHYLYMLRETGYRFPDWVIDSTREEIVNGRQALEEEVETLQEGTQ